MHLSMYFVYSNGHGGGDGLKWLAITIHATAPPAIRHHGGGSWLGWIQSPITLQIYKNEHIYKYLYLYLDLNVYLHPHL